jgi:hypothetical protein
MAHFAEVDEYSNKVVRVIVADQEFIDSGAVGDPKNWIQTSYNTRGGVHYDPTTREVSDTQEKALRKNYAGIGYIYDKERDAFYLPQPYPSWTLNEDTCIWNPPIPAPSGYYIWDEELYQSDNTQGWVLDPSAPTPSE